MALYTAATDQFKPANQWAASKAAPSDNNSRTTEMRSTVALMVSPGRRRLSPPSNSTKLTNSPTTVARPCPKSRGSTNPKPERPINSPESSSNTTPGRPDNAAIRRAEAPANTVTPHSNPSRSGVIDGRKLWLHPEPDHRIGAHHQILTL